MTQTDGKIRNRKFQTEGLPHSCRYLNFRRVEALYLTQPAVTLQIKALEEELGVPLFDPTKNRIALTEAGRILLKHAKKDGRHAKNLTLHHHLDRGSELSAV